jgi:hypothetical protein
MRINFSLTEIIGVRLLFAWHRLRETANQMLDWDEDEAGHSWLPMQ